MWVAVPLAAMICGTIIALSDKAYKASKVKNNRKNEIKMLDSIHVIEMRMQDLEVQLREANDKIMRLEAKKYKEID